MTEVERPSAAPPPWRAKMTKIANPRLLAWIAIATFLAGLLAVVSLVFLNEALKAQPRTVQRDAATLSRILEEAGWASSGGSGPILYVVGFPTCPSCIAFKKTELKRLLAAGLELRAIEFAPRRGDGVSPGEEAKAAEVARSRSWAAYLAPPESYPLAAASDLFYVEEGRATVDSIEALLKKNHTAIAFPAFLWRSQRPDGVRWRFIFGSSSAATDNILAELKHKAPK